jgi:RND family efflux transporter MFP subunit
VKAAVKVRGERLYRHRILAPFDGIVASRLADPGDWLSAGQAAIQLVSAGRVDVLVRVPEDLLDQLHGLDTVALVSDGRRAEGTLLGVVDALDPETRTALLRIEPKQPPAWLRSGKSLDVVFTVERDGGWVVPRDALVYGVGGIRIIAVVDGKAVPVNVEELAVAGNQVLVKGELEKGAVIVTRGNERLRPGQDVTTDNAFGASSASSKGPAPTSSSGTTAP